MPIMYGIDHKWDFLTALVIFRKHTPLETLQCMKCTLLSKIQDWLIQHAAGIPLAMHCSNSKRMAGGDTGLYAHAL